MARGGQPKEYEDAGAAGNEIDNLDRVFDRAVKGLPQQGLALYQGTALAVPQSREGVGL